MKERHTTIGVRTLKEEAENPGQPEIRQLGWKLEGFESINGMQTGRISNPKKGTVEHVVVRTMLDDSRVLVWDQPVWIENPGTVSVPVRRIASGKGNKEDRIIVYMIIVQRPIVNPMINVPRTGAVLHHMEKNGITSLEFPRGISSGSDSNYMFYLSGSCRAEKLQLFGDQSAFEASGGFDEMGEEVPELILHPGTEPILVCGVNPNTSLFATTQGGYIFPISPDTRAAEEKAASSATQQAEQIRGIIPLVYPEETDKILSFSEKMAQTGFWGSNSPIVVDSFTMSMLAQVGRLVRENRIPVTG